MDVRNLNERKILKNTINNKKITQFSIETYFIWFSSFIYVTQLIIDISLVIYYFYQNQLQWGWIMLGIIIVSLILCQIFSICLLRSDVHIIHCSTALCHLFLLAVPYRYYNILRKLDKEKIAKTSLQERINDVNSIQMLNAVCQYFPQFLFQAFLIVYRKYKCVITGVSAGLAAFSFLWHIFIHFYFSFKCNQQKTNCMTYNQYDSNAGTRIIDNLSTNNDGGGGGGGTNSNNTIVSSLTTNATTSQPQQQSQNSIITIASISSTSSSLSSTNHRHHHHSHHQSDTLTKKLKNFEKPLYNTDDKNFVSKKNVMAHKNVEKNNIFNFNKRKPIYEREEFVDFSGVSGGNNNNSNSNNSAIDASTIFFEINDDSQNISTTSAAAAAAALDSGKFYSSISSNNSNHINENNLNFTKSFNKYNTNARKMNDDYKYNKNYDDDVDDLKCHKMNTSTAAATTTANNIIQDHRNTILKRKGICSSQEMLHLVDLMNDHITPEQVDILAKSLIELGGCDDSLLPAYTDDSEQNNSLSSVVTTTTTGAGDNSGKLLFEQFPSIIDDKLLENIDAAIYENQIIFQERIRKNQLTIQNLKLQDQMLSKCMMMMSGDSGGLGAHGGTDCIIDNLMKTPTSSIMPPSELLSIRDYENMCFTNINRQNYGMKHWRNYLNDIDANTHDSSTVQHSSFYVNTTTNTQSNSLTDLYINEIDNDDDDNSTTIIDNLTNNKKTVRWQKQNSKNDEQLSDIVIINGNNGDDDDDDDDVDEDEQLYTIADGGGLSSIPEKNILVQTINKINVDSPLKNLLVNKPSCLDQYYDDDEKN